MTDERWLDVVPVRIEVVTGHVMLRTKNGGGYRVRTAGGEEVPFAELDTQPPDRDAWKKCAEIAVHAEDNDRLLGEGADVIERQIAVIAELEATVKRLAGEVDMWKAVHDYQTRRTDKEIERLRGVMEAGQKLLLRNVISIFDSSERRMDGFLSVTVRDYDRLRVAIAEATGDQTP